MGNRAGLALWFDALDLQKGDRVVHIGCATGYYTAILAEVVGPTGRVTAIEVDPGLASRAGSNLSYLAHVQVLAGDGGEIDLGPSDAIFINAGATHPRAMWLDALRPGGRLLRQDLQDAEPELLPAVAPTTWRPADGRCRVILTITHELLCEVLAIESSPATAEMRLKLQAVGI